MRTQLHSRGESSTSGMGIVKSRCSTVTTAASANGSAATVPSGLASSAPEDVEVRDAVRHPGEPTAEAGPARGLAQHAAPERE